MKIRHGSLEIDIPAEWHDASTLMFVAPAPEVDAPTLNTWSPGTIAVTVRIVRSEVAAEDALEEQRQELERMEVDYRLLESAPFASRLGPGWQYVQRYELDGRPVQQLAIACRLGPFIVLASGACPETRYAHVREQLQQVLASLDAVST